MPGLPDPERDRQFYEGVQSRRLAAWLVDVTLVLAVGVPFALLFGLATLGFGLALFPILVMTVGFLYRTATIAGGSATWGMRLMGIELRRHDGARLDFTTALLHTAIYTVALSVVLLQLASIVGMLATRYGQGLPDIVLRTAMINRPAD
ncbi:MAG: RDD family protein [Rhodobacteraceae bacterium]|nr:RDD family protein [Paracoccaceae bacterium]